MLGGVCTPTHKSAVLNVTDLQDLLASGNVTVTTGSGSLAAQTANIVVASGVTWTSTSVLTLDAYESVTLNSTISVGGTGGASLVTNDGGTGGVLSFGPKGKVTFEDLASNLTINSAAYTLVSNLSTLADDIFANPTSNFALAANYDATSDGTYSVSPVTTTLDGAFEGLGNTISHLSVRDPVQGHKVGLFSDIGASGEVADLNLTAAHIVANNAGPVGGIVGQNDGMLTRDSVAGLISAHGKNFNQVGALAGVNNGTITNSHATARVESGSGFVGTNNGSISYSYSTGAVVGGSTGGLVGRNSGYISASFATGSVTFSGTTGDNGGLVADNSGTITDCYATGAVWSNFKLGAIGGLIGSNGATISFSYSTGQVNGGGAVDYVGGFVGYDQTAGEIADSYWDTTTSGITDSGAGAGNRLNDPGITGMTTSQLQAGLPEGFSDSIWSERENINGGLPYLLANPPP